MSKKNPLINLLHQIELFDLLGIIFLKLYNAHKLYKRYELAKTFFFKSTVTAFKCPLNIVMEIIGLGKMFIFTNFQC